MNGQLTDWLKWEPTSIIPTVKPMDSLPITATRVSHEAGYGDTSHNILFGRERELPIMQLYAHDRDGNYILNADGSRKVFENDGEQSVVGWPDSSDTLGQPSRERAETGWN
jgi:hypothetical protein